MLLHLLGVQEVNILDSSDKVALVIAVVGAAAAAFGTAFDAGASLVASGIAALIAGLTYYSAHESRES